MLTSVFTRPLYLLLESLILTSKLSGSMPALIQIYIIANGKRSLKVNRESFSLFLTQLLCSFPLIV